MSCRVYFIKVQQLYIGKYCIYWYNNDSSHYKIFLMTDRERYLIVTFFFSSKCTRLKKLYVSSASLNPMYPISLPYSVPPPFSSHSIHPFIFLLLYTCTLLNLLTLICMSLCTEEGMGKGEERDRVGKRRQQF